MATKPRKQRSKKTAPKKTIALKSTSVAPADHPMPSMGISTSLPSIKQLSTQAYQTLWQHKKLFASIAAVYAMLNGLFASGLSSYVDVTTIRNQYGSKVLGSLAAYGQLVGSSAAGSNQASSVYQALFFFMTSLALIWTLRQVYAGNNVRLRDGFYQGMYPFVPCGLVLLVIVLQLLPMIIGSSVYTAVVANGIASSPLAIITWGLFALVMALVSLYFISASLFGFYVASLPDMAPVRALRLGQQLVKGRRWLVLRKVLALPLMLVLLAAIVLLPIILLLPTIAQFCLLLAWPILVALGHSYMYSLYRGLMHEQIA